MVDAFRAALDELMGKVTRRPIMSSKKGRIAYPERPAWPALPLDAAQARNVGCLCRLQDRDLPPEERKGRRARFYDPEVGRHPLAHLGL